METRSSWTIGRFGYTSGQSGPCECELDIQILLVRVDDDALHHHHQLGHTGSNCAADENSVHHPKQWRRPIRAPPHSHIPRLHLCQMDRCSRKDKHSASPSLKSRATQLSWLKVKLQLQLQLGQSPGERVHLRGLVDASATLGDRLISVSKRFALNLNPSLTLGAPKSAQSGRTPNERGSLSSINCQARSPGALVVKFH